MNDELKFREFIDSNLAFLEKEGKPKVVDFFIGRDTRPTSSGLSKIIMYASLEVEKDWRWQEIKLSILENQVLQKFYRSVSMFSHLG